MGFAISLRSDHASADRIRNLWTDVQNFEDQASMALLGYPPHVTLAIYDDAVGEAEIRKALDTASANLRAVILTFDVIRTLTGRQ